MRGRRPKPDALKRAQGNPGRRPVSVHAQDDGDEPGRSVAHVVTLKARAKKVYELIGPQLRQINFLRPTDEHAFQRYCETLARYWSTTEKLDKSGATYECEMTAGGKMQRIHPVFIVQQMLAKRLDALEDRFGLTPAARQQYMLALSRAPMRLPGLDEPPAKPTPEIDAVLPPPQERPSAIGALRRSDVN